MAIPRIAPRSLPPTGRLGDDDVAFRAVYERHHATVLRALKRLTRDDAEAEDLAQETFMLLGDHRFEADREHNLRAWLLRTAVNRGLNARRGDARRSVREAAIGLELVSDAAPSPDRVRLRQRVREVLLQLEPRTCQLLVLRAVGLSYAELAEVVGVAPGSIGTLIVRAQRSFTSAYEDRHGAGPGEEIG